MFINSRSSMIRIVFAAWLSRSSSEASPALKNSKITVRSSKDEWAFS
jgi:hypothetical protein